jgi:hypothetical protein
MKCARELKLPFDSIVVASFTRVLVSIVSYFYCDPYSFIIAVWS